MKILIAGSGKVGETLAKQLSSEDHDVTLIDSDPQVLESDVERYDVFAVQGNCASMETLHQAGVEGAHLLIATTGTDELNLLCCMTAHAMNPLLHTIARIRNPEYTEQAYRMRDAFGLSLAFNPERQTAIEIERLLKYPGFLKRDSFAKGHMEIVELKLDASSKLCNIPLSDIYGIIKCRILVCAVLRGGETIMPDGNFTLCAGDRLFVTAPSDELSQLMKNLGIVVHKTKHVILLGGGKVSYYLADLLRKSRIDVKIVEWDPERCRRLAELLPDVNVIQGDVNNHYLLESEGIGSCDALVSLTGLDELNIITSLYGSSCKVPQIITKIGKTEDMKIVDDLPIGSVVCPRKLCCNTIVRYVRAMQNQTGAAITVHTIADGQAEALEFRADESTLHLGEPLKKIKLRRNILIVGISRGGKMEIPNGDSCFEAGDTVVVVEACDDVIRQLNDIFE